jgi:hypothetical protein
LGSTILSSLEVKKTLMGYLNAHLGMTHKRTMAMNLKNVKLGFLL